MDGIPLVVYNPHSWKINQWIDAQIKFAKPTPEFKITDANGKPIEFLISKASEDHTKFEVNIHAREIPGLGYKVFEVEAGKSQTIESGLKVSGNTIESQHYKIEWNNAGLTSIYSKNLNREILKDIGNHLRLLEDNGSSWSLKYSGHAFDIKSLKNAEIVFSSPLKVVVKWEDYFQTSKFTRYMTLYSDAEHIDFEMEVDWQSHNKLLKVVFPTRVQNGENYYDQPYGYVKRKNTALDFPAQKWIDCSNESFGVSLINNGKYGFTINEGELSMSVVRGARDMDPGMDKGLHSFKYSLFVHEGDWRTADLPKKGWEFNQPLFAKQENHHPGEISGWRFSDLSFPPEKSFFGINSDHVIISSVKTKQDAYNPNPIILRIVETEGRSENVWVSLPYEPVSVTECNHIEKPIEEKNKITLGEKGFSFKIGNDEIRTFMIHF